MMLLSWLACSSPQDPGAFAEAKEVAPPFDTGESERLPLCINEWMPSNKAALFLPDGSSPDWLELHNPTDEEVPLAAWTVTDDLEEPDKHPLDPELSIAPGGHLLLFASGDASVGPRHLDFKLSEDSGVVALFSPLGDGTAVRYGRVEADFSVARSTDCCLGPECLGFDLRGTPGFNNLATQGGRETLIFQGSSWRYQGTGGEQGGWHLSSFDDGAWASGAGPLGYGDAHVVTVLPMSEQPSVWFRHSFTVEEVDEVTALRLELLLDDGARVWLNGELVLSENLSAQADSLSWALGEVEGPNELLRVDYALDPRLLVDAENLLAVEVHQASLVDPDLGFDVRLTAQRH